MRPRTLGLLSVVAAVAVAGGVAVARSGDRPFRNSPDASKVLDQIDPTVRTDAGPAGFEPAAAPLASPARSDPATAVRNLLDALIARDANRSYGLLAAADRATVGTAASWGERLPSLPRYLTYTVTSRDGRAVTTDVAIEPRLDEVVGYVPARAQVTWVTETEDGGYRVSFAESTTGPCCRPDDAARSAAEAWVTDQQQCRPGPSYDGNLLGQPTLADALCRARAPSPLAHPSGWIASVTRRSC